jgi:hypothetical protein
MGPSTAWLAARCATLPCCKEHLSRSTPALCTAEKPAALSGGLQSSSVQPARAKYNRQLLAMAQAGQSCLGSGSEAGATFSAAAG